MLKEAGDPPRAAQPTASWALPLPLPLPWACAAAVLSGVLYWLAFPTVDAWPLAFVAWVPLIVAVRKQPTGRATLIGAIAGWTMNVAGFFWLIEMLKTFSGFSPVICFLLLLIVCSYQGSRIGLLGWLYGRASGRGWPPGLVFAGAFVASELLFPLLFPWYFAATVHSVPVLMQGSDLGGPILVGLAPVAFNIGLAELTLARAEARPVNRWPLIVGAASVLLTLAYGALRIRMVDAAASSAPGATVGIAQANMGLMEKRTLHNEGINRHLDLSADLKSRGADFLVWSETSAMHAVSDETYQAELRTLASRIHLPAVFGAVIVKRVSDEREYVLYNSAVSSDAAGRVGGRYDKEYLLAFGEYLPFGESLPILYKWSPNSGHFSSGTSFDPLPLEVRGEPHPVTALICYEDILPRFTNAAVRVGNPELLVNITNDAWFGDTAEPWEHLALAQFRAVEHRRYFVRGTNSGVSAVIDPVGRVIAHSGTFRQEAVTAPIHWMRAHTVYEALGDWPWVLVSCAAVLGAFVRARPRVNNRAGDSV